MSELVAELRYAARALRRQPGFTLAAVLLLAIGIGTASVLVTLARGTFGTYPPHVSEPDRLVRVTRTTSDVFAGAMGYPDYAVLRDENHTLAGLAAYDRGPVPLMARANGTMRQVNAGMVSGEYFAVLGTQPVLGRRANVRGRRLLVAAALVACLPARRAAAVDPVEVLRDE